jgi:hypothetical protein
MSAYRGFNFENVVFPAASLPAIIEKHGDEYLDDHEDQLEISPADTVVQILEAITDNAGHADTDPKTTVTPNGELTFSWSRGVEDIAYGTSDDLTGLLDFAAPGGMVTVRDDEVDGGEYRLVRLVDGTVERQEPELLYPDLGTPTPTPAQLAAVIEFAERGLSRELGAIDVRNHYTEAELATMKARFEDARGGLEALRAAAA